MNENLKIFFQISGITSAILVISLVPVTFLGNARLAWGVFYGYLVSLINILFAFFSIKWAFNKSTKTFFAVVLGGMGVRFLVVISALFFAWKIAKVPLIGFVVSLVVFYLTLQIFEVRFIQNELRNRKVA
jgi:CHASE2 domain-containing sensor protein